MRHQWFCGAIGLIFLAGCVKVQTYTLEKPRTDLEVRGSQGYLSGVAKEDPKPNRLGTTRKVSVLEVDLGPRQPDTPAASQEAAVEVVTAEESIPLTDDTEPYVEQITVSPEPQKEATYYTVEKDDTLQKIAQKFYGTTR